MNAATLALAGLLVSLVGIVAGQAAVAVTGMLLATIAGLSRIWARHSLSGVSLELGVGHQRARPGDSSWVEIRVENDQPFPVPWLDCQIDWPEGIPSVDARLGAHYLPGRQLLAQAFTLRWFERVRRRLRISLTARGEYLLGPTQLVVADPFGLSEGTKTEDARQRVVVYPRVHPVRVRGRDTRSPFGHRPRQCWIYDDPAFFRGSREYVRDDPFSRIDWNATARTGRLHTRLLDAPYTSEVALVVNVATGPQVWEGIRRQLLEWNLEVAASLADHLLGLGHRLALYTNGFVKGQPAGAAARMGAGSERLRACLEVLGRLMPLPAMEASVALNLAAQKAGDRARIILVTPIASAQLERATNVIASRGCAVSIVFTTVGPHEWRAQGTLFEACPGGDDGVGGVTLNPACC